MNERINGLWEQCKTPNWTYDNQTYDHEKFAELIVRECVQICKTVNSVKVVNAPDTYQEGREMGSFMCMEEIKKHFGVEE